MNIIAVDYGLGNLFSLYNAFDFCGTTLTISSAKDELLRADALVLPGVGAFGDGMTRLRKGGLDSIVIELARRGTPVLGICLGMQLLLEKSEEFGSHSGLGLISGEVKSFLNLEGFDRKCKVPHIGWNRIAVKPEAPLLDGLDGKGMYFIHSFCAVPVDQGDIAATAHYGGIEFCAVIRRGNLFGCQFHPEKSAEAGLHLIMNFIDIVRGVQ